MQLGLLSHVMEESGSSYWKRASSASLRMAEVESTAQGRLCAEQRMSLPVQHAEAMAKQPTAECRRILQCKGTRTFGSVISYSPSAKPTLSFAGSI